MSIIVRDGSFTIKTDTKNIDVFAELLKTNCVPLEYIDDETIKLSHQISEYIFLFISRNSDYAGMELHEWLNKLSAGMSL